MAGQAKVYFKVENDTTAFGVALQINSFVYDIALNKLWNITQAAAATDTLSTVLKTQVNAGGGGGASDITDLTNSSTTQTSITDSWFFQLWVSGTTWYKVTWDSIKTALTALFALKTLSNADISSLDEEATPVATDMLYLQKADGTKKKVDFDKFGGGGTNHIYTQIIKNF